MKRIIRYFVNLCFIIAFLIVSCLVTAAQTYRGETAQWVIQIGGVNDDEASTSVVVDGNGDATVAGEFRGSIKVGDTTLTSTTPEYYDVFVARVSPEGSIQWVTQIGGELDDRVGTHGRADASELVLDENNNVYVAIYSESSRINVSGVDVEAISTRYGNVMFKPQLVVLQKNGKYSRYISNMDYPGGGDAGTQRVLFATEQNNSLLFADTPGGPNGCYVRKTNATGDVVFKKYLPYIEPYALQPRVQGITTDAKGDHYFAVQFSDTLRYDNTVVVGMKDDVAILKIDSLGKAKWVATIDGPALEGVIESKIEDDKLVVIGYYGFDSKDSVRFGNVTLKRIDERNVFRAQYRLDDGTLLNVSPLPIQIGISVPRETNVSIVDFAPAYIVNSPGEGLLEFNGSVTNPSWYYNGGTYSRGAVCDRHYLLGQFSDTLRLAGNNPQLVSRGGKDIYLALMDPPGKYVPDRAGLREPLNSALNLDIPTVLEWWWVGCSNGHQLQVSRDSAMTQIVHDSLVTSGTKETLTNLSHSTTYYWRVRAVTADTFGMWSEVRSFTTVKAQPADVVLEYPANSSQGVVKTNTLRWTSSKRATNYIVDVAADSTFSEKVVNGKLVSSTTLDVSLESNKTYYWRVRAGNAAGTSPWSQVWTFTTRPDRPAATLLLSPSDRSTNEVVNTHFVWQSQGTGINYSLQVARDSSFQFKEVDINVMETAWRDTLEANTTYFWRVRASTPFESGDWSLPWSFTTGTVLGVDETTGTGALRVVYADGSLLISTHDESLSQQKVEVSIYTISGERILQSPMQFTSTPMRVVPPSMARGTYMVQIIRNDGSSVATSFMVK